MNPLPLLRLRRSPRLFRLVGLPVAFAMACAQSTGVGVRDPDIARVLFVGNSLTQWNDLPGMVRALAASAGLRWEVQADLIGGSALEDHIREGTVVRLLAEDSWDFVVLQQGPSTLPESRENLRSGAATFRPLIAGAGARAALYQVWPDSTWSASRFLADFDRVRDSYALAALDISGLFLPAGEAWRIVLASDPGLPLYGNDGFHPSPTGTYLAALTIFGRLSGRSAQGLARRLATVDGQVLVELDPGLALRLQQAADSAIAAFTGYMPVDQP